MQIIKNSNKLAEILEVGESTVGDWRRRHGMPYQQISVNRYEYKLDKVLTWLANRSPRHRRHVERILKKLNASTND